MTNRTKIIVGALGLVVVLGAIYVTFFNNNADTSALSASGQPASAAEVVFLNLASRINPIVFDTSVLSDPRFSSLVDIHTAIVPEPAGRTNPFAPFAGSAVVSASSQTASTQSLSQ